MWLGDLNNVKAEFNLVFDEILNPIEISGSGNSKYMGIIKHALY